MANRELKTQLYSHFAEIAKALASPYRLELLDLLSQCERSVEQLAQQLQLAIANTSQHLQILRQAHLVKTRKVGSYVFYQLSDSTILGLLRHLQAVAHQQLAEVEQVTQLYLQARDQLEPLAAVELQKRLVAGEVTVLDVRPLEEYQAGHIPGALSMPLETLQARLNELPHNREIVAYCRGPYCVFAPQAVTILQEHGFKARRLLEGLPDWRAAGREVVTAT